VANVAYAQADAEALPFADGTFDAVTCRFGVMQFPDAPTALRELLRVLVPGGMAVCLVWGPPERHAQQRPLAVVRRYISLPEPGPNEPHRFRYSGAGELAGLLRDAGFTAVREETHVLPAPQRGTPEERWRALLRNSERVRTAVAGLPDERRRELEQEVLAALRDDEARAGGPTAAVVLVTGVR
jgi:SAM-dependent methyltransferase